MTSGTTPLYRNLDTTFVNLWSLLRNLTERGFVGRVHVDLQDYSADIFLDGSSTPLTREIDQAAGTDTLEAGALHRVVLRARETPGTISVFEGAHEASAPHQQTAAEPSPLPPPPAQALTEPSPDAGATSHETLPAVEPTGAATSTPSANEQSAEIQADEKIYPAGSYQDWPAILATTGELIGAVERALNATGRNFISLFETVRLELADDYIFLDPIVKTFHYSSGVASLKNEPAVSVFVSGVSEALRRTVDRVAVGDRARRVRELVALEMLSVARQHAHVLERSGFRAQLDRMAGTRVM
jgi:hypothetical protein